MPYCGSDFTKDQYYHVFNRGAGKGPIFINPGNYTYLTHLIKRYSLKYHVAIIAYCLMPNHYHFFLRQESDIPLSKFINVLFIAYVQAINLQQGRKGTLFEGRFHSVCVDRFEYLIHLCRYIHNNPRKAGLVQVLEDWPYSNYLDWVGLRNGELYDREFITDFYPGSSGTYRQFVDDLQDEMLMTSQISRYLWD